MIPHSMCHLGPREADAVAQAVRDNFVGSGPRAAELEARMRQLTGRAFAWAVSSGAHALQLALAALDLPPNSRVALPVLTCGSVLAAVRGSDAIARLYDIDDHLRLDLAAVASDGRADAAVVPWAYGAPPDAARLARLTMPLIEDCATSLAPGSGRAGMASVFSLASTKYATGGMGGVLVADDQGFAERVEDLLAIDRPPASGSWRGDAPAARPGRLADLNAALALTQLDRLAWLRSRRQQIAAIYQAGLSGVAGLELPALPQHDYFRFIVRTEKPGALLAERMHGRGVDARASVNPWLDGFTAANIEIATALPCAGRWRSRLLSLPIHPSLSDGDCGAVVDGLRQELKA